MNEDRQNCDLTINKSPLDKLKSYKQEQNNKGKRREGKKNRRIDQDIINISKVEVQSSRIFPSHY